MGNHSSSIPGVDQAMLAVDFKKRHHSRSSRKMRSSLDKGSSHSKKSSCLEKASSHSRKSSSGLDKGSSHSRKRSGLDKGSSHSRRSYLSSNSDDMDDYEMEDVIELLKELNRNDQGKELLVEYVDYQTGKTKQKPRLMGLIEESSMSHSHKDIPIKEIMIGSIG